MAAKVGLPRYLSEIKSFYLGKLQTWVTFEMKKW